MFQLRGQTKAQILDDLRRLRSTGTVEVNPDEKAEVESQSSQSAVQPHPLENQPNEAELAVDTPIQLEQFWQYDEPLDPSLVVITPPPDNRTVLDVLGTIPLAAADSRVMQYFREVYQRVSQQAMMSALNRET